MNNLSACTAAEKKKRVDPAEDLSDSLSHAFEQLMLYEETYDQVAPLEAPPVATPVVVAQQAHRTSRKQVRTNHID
jgi:uncharacterized protein with GYD domain